MFFALHDWHIACNWVMKINSDCVFRAGIEAGAIAWNVQKFDVPLSSMLLLPCSYSTLI